MTTALAERRPTAAPLTGRDVLCFSHDWSSDPLSKTHLMRLVARDNRVLWVNSIGYRAPTLCKADLRRAVRKLWAAAEPVREVERNVFVLNPVAVPAWRYRAGRALNAWLLRQVRRAMRRLGFRRAVNFVFNPAAGVVAGRLGEDRVVYYCVDEYAAFAGVPAALAAVENRLLERADLVVVSAERLRETRARVNPRTALIRHGVDYEHFRAALDPATRVPADAAGLPRPVLGYFGLMSPDWVDVELLVRVARRFAHGSLVLIGKVAMDLSALTRLPNVRLLGHRPYADLPAYCKGFDVALVPFPVSPVTLHANPLKAREYLAAGLPVVSTAIPEVEALGLCHVAGDAEEFVRLTELALRRPGPDAERSAAMRSETWDARLDALRTLFAALD